MVSERAIEIRDRLVDIVDEVMADGDQDAHIIACCLAVGVEELEKWMYDEDFTPSVAPYRDSRKFEIPFKDGEDGEDFSGTPWKRKRKSILDKNPALKKVIEKEKHLKALMAKRKMAGLPSKPAPPRVALSLISYPINEWTPPILDEFRSGERSGLSRAIRMETRAPMKEITDIINEAIDRYLDIWGIDKKPGDKCPHCGNDKIGSGASRLYSCHKCGTNWGRW